MNNTNKIKINPFLIIVLVPLFIFLTLGFFSAFILIIMFAIQNIVSLYSGVKFEGLLFNWQAFLSIAFFIILIDLWNARNFIEIQKKMAQLQRVLQEQLESFFLLKNEKKNDSSSQD